MLSLPIAHREMLVQAKSPALHKGRVRASVVLLLMGFGFSLLYKYVGITAVRQVVHGLTFVALMICAFGGMSVTADCIAREKRDGTLGLLFLTHLSSAEIALGKLIAGGLGLIYGILVALPLFSLFVIAGGIAWTEVLAIAGIALNILFASAAIGLYASTVSLDRKKASSRAVWIVIFFWWLLPVGADFARRFGAHPAIPLIMQALAFSTSLGVFTFGPAPPMMGGVMPHWVNIICVHAMGWLFVTASIYYLPRRWQDHPARQRFNLREWWKQVSYGRGDTRLRLRLDLLNRSAFLWLAARDRSRNWHGWVMTLGAVTIMMLILFGNPNKAASCVIALLVANVVLQLIWTGTCTYQLEMEREQGTIEMLLSTPLRPQEIMRGQWLALLRYYGGPIALLFGLKCVLAAYFLFFDSNADSRLIGAILMAVNLVFLLNYVALHHAGLWAAVTVKQQKQAAATAIAQCIFIPILIAGLIFAMVGLLTWLLGPFWSPQPIQVFGIWYSLQCGIDAFWIALTRKSLPSKMREWAMRRYEQKEPKEGWAWLRRLVRSKSVT